MTAFVWRPLAPGRRVSGRSFPAMTSALVPATTVGADGKASVTPATPDFGGQDQERKGAPRVMVPAMRA